MTVGNGRMGFWTVRDGRVGNILGRDRAERVSGSVTSVCWDWNKELIE